MTLAETFEATKSGVFHIVFVDGAENRIASGTGFASCSYLITNHHVFLGPPNSRVCIRAGGNDLLVLPYADFAERLKSGSDQDNFDFAVLDVPEIMNQVHQFTLDGENQNRIGRSNRISWLSV